MARYKRKDDVPEPSQAGLGLADIVDRLFIGHAAKVMADFPAGCVDLIVTSPPYWTAVEYDQGESPWPIYEAYLDDMHLEAVCPRAPAERQALYQRPHHADPEGVDRTAHPALEEHRVRSAARWPTPKASGH